MAMVYQFVVEQFLKQAKTQLYEFYALCGWNCDNCVYDVIKWEDKLGVLVPEFDLFVEVRNQNLHTVEFLFRKRGYFSKWLERDGGLHLLDLCASFLSGLTISSVRFQLSRID